MRDQVQTSEDLAIAAAKERLLGVSSHPGYAEAIRPAPTGSRTQRAIVLAVALAFAGLAVASLQLVASTWLRWVLVLLLTGFTLLSLLLAIGVGPTAPLAVHGAAVLAKTAIANADIQVIRLLLSDGTVVDAQIADTLFDALRVGDVGVAHLAAQQSASDKPSVAAFHRM